MHLMIISICYLYSLTLKKAFDSVNHSIILAKLEKCGIRGVALDWFTSYLTGRSQRTVFEDVVSQPRTINTGVPQGSLLGVILFQLHIDSLKNCLRHTSAILYADDTTIYAIGRNLKALKSDINNLSMWLNSNKLLLNVNKTKSVLFSKHPNTGVELYVGKQKIESVKCFKFLGFYLDSTLSFQHHAFWLTKSLLNVIFIVRKLASFIPV